MYPWSSDDGFSVKDYRQIAPELGGWQDVEAMAKDFNLMFDFVINHISRKAPGLKGIWTVMPATRIFPECRPGGQLPSGDASPGVTATHAIYT
jgi:hypothetical protein